MRTVEVDCVVTAPPAAVWPRVVDPDGINDEMRPWLTMTMPRRAAVQIDALPLGQPLGHAWLRLFGVLPVEADHLTLVDVEPGRRFLERSTMLSLTLWEHERTLMPVTEGTRVRDRLTFVSRFPAPGVEAVMARVVTALFRHRHGRLQRHFAMR